MIDIACIHAPNWAKKYGNEKNLAAKDEEFYT